jgi:hypothetical protein
MIVRKRVIKIGNSKYVGLPRKFGAQSKELLVIHDRLIGFADPNIQKMDDVEFKKELSALAKMLTDARQVLRAESYTNSNYKKRILHRIESED